MRCPMSERERSILEMLTKENKLEVALIAERLGVSSVTVRKDLDQLEGQGLVVREHGAARLRSADDMLGRMAYHYEEKQRIAKRAAELVTDGETLMIESGSCCALLAKEVATTKKSVTIITNSAFIAGSVRGQLGCQVVLLGGIYQPEAQVVVGPLLGQTVSGFFVDHLFIGVDGFSEKTGFCNRDQMRAQAVGDMAKQAEKIIVLTESEKFEKKSVVPCHLDEEKITVITDDGITAEIEAILQHRGMQCIKVGV